MQLLVIMDPIQHINIKKDSTIAMLWAAAARGHTLWYAQMHSLYLHMGQAFVQAQPLDVFEDATHYYTLGDAQNKALNSFDVVLQRKDPPFDMNYIYGTYFLEQAERDGAWVINNPRSVRDCNEKLFATQFAHLMVPTLVSSRQTLLKAFIQEHNDVIVKPLDGMGGMGIFRLQTGSPNIGATLEMLTTNQQLPIMAQKYIPQIVDGDKRILMINGEPAPYCLARIPTQGETRGNLAAGGRGEARPLTMRDQEIAAQIGPVLKQKGLMFVGLDVIGDYVTEINVTSPTCIREIDAQCGTQLAHTFIQAIEQELQNRQAKQPV